MIAEWSVLAVIAPLSSRCSVCLDVCRMWKDCLLVNYTIMRHIWTVKERRNCWNCGIQRGFVDTARGKVCDFAFLTSSGGKFYAFFMTVALAIPPLIVKNRRFALIWACALNRKNMVVVLGLGPQKFDINSEPCKLWTCVALMFLSFH